MKVHEILTVGGSEYYLKITAAHAVKLEEDLGTDLITGMDKLAEVKTLAKYYYAAAKAQNDAIRTIEDVYQLFDDYVTAGGTLDDLQFLMMDVLVTSGILTKDVNEAQKKMLLGRREALQKLSDEVTANLLKSVSSQISSGALVSEKSET